MLIPLRKAQSSLEYAALIGVVVGAIIIMSTYMRRSTEGKLRSEADELGEQYEVHNGSYQYNSTLLDQEITYSAMGTIDNQTEKNLLQAMDDVQTDSDWMHKDIVTGQGAQLQYTKDEGKREVNETIKANAYK